ncbi:MAG: DUF86 domain-containing protein [Oscillospiraceae bacterium]|jgi:uncharacterized protein with HEPN domain|nr:DUF86 domain-containing protein [Oscillospiraceae bacterium]
MSSKDLNVLCRIIKYCNQINETCNDFDNSKKKFTESVTFRNAVCLCLLQIGELGNQLSEEFKENSKEIPWRSIKFLRNIVAHDYDKVDYDIVWDICICEIPVLLKFCTDITENS